MNLINNETRFHVSEQIELNGFVFPPFFFADEEARYAYNVQVIPVAEGDQPTLADLKDEKLFQLKESLGKELSVTDWYFIRQMETGKPVPESILNFREQLRRWADEVELRINKVRSAKTLEAISVHWSEDGSDNQAG